MLNVFEMEIGRSNNLITPSALYWINNKNTKQHKNSSLCEDLSYMHPKYSFWLIFFIVLLILYM